MSENKSAEVKEKQEKKARFSAEFLGELTFFFSVTNVIFSTWVISVAPWKYVLINFSPLCTVLTLKFHNDDDA